MQWNSLVTDLGVEMRAIVSIACGFLLVPTVHAGNVLLVDQSAAGPLHDGSAWCSAHIDLQDALATAIAGDEIRVANGTYVPDRGSGDRTAAFQLIDGVSLYGGFAGCELLGLMESDETSPPATSGPFSFVPVP